MWGLGEYVCVEGGGVDDKMWLIVYQSCCPFPINAL